ncbi:MAG: hypothetical protein P8X52_07475 [Limibacillus sp.]
MAEETLEGPRQEPKSGGPAKALVVLLHGWGADGNDLIGLAPLLGQVLPDAAFVAPNAPDPCEMNPAGRQWFSLQDRTPAEMEAGRFSTWTSRSIPTYVPACSTPSTRKG